jgi:hypothetical protein
MSSQNEFDITLVKDNRDIILVQKPYCEDCAIRKLDILKIFPIEKREAYNLISKYKTYACKVKCECLKNH